MPYICIISGDFGIRNCDTVKKARAWLDQHGVDYEFHDYKLAGIELDRLKRWSGELGWETLLNRAGTSFRKLPDREKGNLNEQNALALMAAQPSMIKRPVVELRGRLIVGFKPELYKSLFSTRRDSVVSAPPSPTRRDRPGRRRRPASLPASGLP